jgi:hypothetical protein
MPDPAIHLALFGVCFRPPHPGTRLSEAERHAGKGAGGVQDLIENLRVGRVIMMGL